MDSASNRLTNPAESRALTGLRGIGALLVIIHHLYLHLDIVPHPAIDGLVRRGYLGVDLFFVLSGFVLSLVYGSWFDGTGGNRTRSVPIFFVRRMARLWPLHAAVLLLILVFAGSGPHQHLTPRLLTANFAGIQAWGFSRSLNPPTWSISTELLAYLCFPAMAGPLLRGRLGFWGGVAVVAVLLGLALAFAPPLGPGRRGWLDLYQNYSLGPLARCLAGFTLGMLAWRAGRAPAVKRLFSNGWAGPAAMLAVLIFLLTGINDLAIYPLLPLVVLGMHFGTGLIVRPFAEGPLHWLGLLSYAVYLVHYALLYHFPFGLGPLWLTLAAFLATTFVLAWLAHRLVEIPGRVLLRRAGERLVRRVASFQPPLQRGPP